MNKEQKKITEPELALILVKINKVKKKKARIMWNCGATDHVMISCKKCKYNREKKIRHNMEGTPNNPQGNTSDLVMCSFIDLMTNPIIAVESAATL